MCGLHAESVLFGSPWLPLVFPLGLLMGSVLLLGIIGLLVIWLLPYGTPPWLSLLRRVWPHDWRGENFSTFSEEQDARGSEQRMRSPEHLKW